MTDSTPKRRVKARGSTRAVRMIERRLRAWLRDHLPDHDPDLLMDAVRPQVLRAAGDHDRAAALGGDNAAKDDDPFRALSQAIGAAIARGVGRRG